MKIFALLLLSLPLVAAHAQGCEEARSSLKKWGMAYCLSKFQTQAPQDEAGRARGAYFQLGQHNNEEAYGNVRSYFDRLVPADTRVARETSEPNNLMRCLDAYENPAYSRLIRDQDQWLN